MRKALALILVIITVSSLFACNTSNAPKEAYYSFSDSLGNKITLSEKPQRVAVLFSSFADIWVSSGGTVNVTVGESVERGFAPSSAILVDSGAGHTSIDMEALIAADVDFVIGTADYACQVKAAEKMNSLGVPSALFKVEKFEDYLSVLKIFAEITEREDLYLKNGLEVQEKIEAIKSKVAQHSADLFEILFLRAGSSERSTKAKSSSDNFAAAMLKELGCLNIADRAPVLLDGLSIETVISEDPEYIFISIMGDEDAAKVNVNGLFQKDGWNTLSSVKNGKYYFLPKDLFHYKPNSRWDEAYLYLARLLCPDISL